MYKIYFKQAIQMLKLNKFISILTIIGTAFAIMMIMTLIVTQAVKDISIAPEDKRDRTMYIKYQVKTSKDTTKNASNSGGISYSVYKDYLSKINTPELISLKATVWGGSGYMVTADPKKGREKMRLNMVDDTYWQLISFDFIEGKPFTKEELDAGIKKAIISQSTASKLYGKENALGKLIEIDFIEYTVAGVIKDASPVFTFSHADVYIPYTTVNYTQLGFQVLLLAKDKEDFKAIENEVKECERKYNATDNEWNIDFNGPYNHQVQQINVWSNLKPNVSENTRKTIFILAMLLIIPAINLSSFSMSSIKKRTEEIGIRKAFGAKKYVILIQVLYENLITSLIGGIIGICLSFGVVYWLKGWLFNIDANSSLPIQTLISLPVFISVFVACVLLNLISASIPALRASHMKIVDSINSNKK